MINKPLYTISEVADIIGVSRQAVWGKVKRGTIQVDMSIGGREFIGHEEVERLRKEYNKVNDN